jgi:hypothetical protein
LKNESSSKSVSNESGNKSSNKTNTTHNQHSNSTKNNQSEHNAPPSNSDNVSNESIKENENNVNSHANTGDIKENKSLEKVGRKALKYTGIAGAAFTAYEAGELYNKYIKQGYSSAEAAAKTGYDVANDATFNAMDGAVNQYKEAVDDFNKGEYLKGVKDTIKVPVKAAENVIDTASDLVKDVGNAAWNYLSTNHSSGSANASVIPNNVVAENNNSQSTTPQDTVQAIAAQIRQETATKDIAIMPIIKN